MDDRLVDVVERRSWVHRQDDADMLFGAFEGDTNGFLIIVALPVGRLFVGALPVGLYLFVM